MNHASSEFDKAVQDAKNARVPTPRGLSPFVKVLVVICVVVLVAAILWPHPHGSRGSARRIICSSHLRQIGQGLMQYAQEHDDMLPRMINGKTIEGKAFSWRRAVHPFIVDEGIWRCPSNESSETNNPFDDLPQSYDVVDVGPIRYGKPVGLGQIQSPSRTILAFEENGTNAEALKIGVLWDKDSGSDNWKNILYADHLATSNYLFADGHVKSLRPLKTIANDVNSWNIDNAVPVSQRARVKLQIAQRRFE